MMRACVAKSLFMSLEDEAFQVWGGRNKNLIFFTMVFIWNILRKVGNSENYPKTRLRVIRCLLIHGKTAASLILYSFISIKVFILLNVFMVILCRRLVANDITARSTLRNASCGPAVQIKYDLRRKFLTKQRYKSDCVWGVWIDVMDKEKLEFVKNLWSEQCDFMRSSVK